MLIYICSLLHINFIINTNYTPVLLPGKAHGWRSLVGCSPWGRRVHGVAESDTTELLHFHFSLSCIGEGNGNLLQCSCLENPGDGGAWWASVYWVAESRTRLKRLSSSSSSSSSSMPPYIYFNVQDLLSRRWRVVLGTWDSKSDKSQPAA